MVLLIVSLSYILLCSHCRATSGVQHKDGEAKHLYSKLTNRGQYRAIWHFTHTTSAESTSVCPPGGVREARSKFRFGYVGIRLAYGELGQSLARPLPTQSILL